MRRLLLAVDGSDHSWRAARLAGVLSSALEAEIDILHVTERPPAVPSDVLAEFEQLEGTYVPPQEMMVAAGSRIVARAAAVARDEGGVVRKEESIIGQPAREIAEHAERLGVDAIVMGRRGLGGARGLLLGSVSHKVGYLTDKTLITTE